MFTEGISFCARVHYTMPNQSQILYTSLLKKWSQNVRKSENLKKSKGVLVLNNETGTFNTAIICQFRVMAPEVLTEDQQLSLLILDSAPCHTTELLRAKAEKHGIQLVYVPPRMTPLLQPADVCWLAVVKRAFSAKYQRWVAKRDFKETRYGNPCSP
jgi:hypothetical protein